MVGPGGRWHRADDCWLAARLHWRYALRLQRGGYIDPNQARCSSIPLGASVSARLSHSALCVTRRTAARVGACVAFQLWHSASALQQLLRAPRDGRKRADAASRPGGGRHERVALGLVDRGRICSAVPLRVESHARGRTARRWRSARVRVAAISWRQCAIGRGVAQRTAIFVFG